MTAKEVRARVGSPIRTVALNPGVSRCPVYGGRKDLHGIEVIVCYFRGRADFVHYVWPL
jgi:hypothetical protein